MIEERQVLAAWLAGHDYSHWCTWTFGQKWPQGPGADTVRRHVSGFLAGRRDVGPWFFVVERGQSGQMRAHAHGLIGPRYPDIGVLRQDCWRDWSKRFGRNTVDPLKDPRDRLLWYVTKYVTKGAERRLGDLAWWIGDNR